MKDSNADEGFTLIELLISIILLGIIMSALVFAMEMAFGTIDTSRQMVTDSSGAQLLVSYFPTDVQSVGQGTVGNPSPTDHVQPTDFSCDPSANSLLELRWADAATGIVNDVVYSITPSGTDQALQRELFTGVDVAAQTCGLASTATLVPSIDAATTNVQCQLLGSTSFSSTCNDNAQQVEINVTAFSHQPKTNNYSSYAFTVAGWRRAA